MSKAILVMDMPSSCAVCPLFCPHYSDMSCRANGRGINYPYPKEVRQDWCALKPMPRKKEEWTKTSGTSKGVHGAKRNGFNTGYNACIDEILGGGE